MGNVSNKTPLPRAAPKGIRQVAERAGVAISSVSRALSNHPHVSPSIRVRVEEAARALNYSPNRIARELRSRRRLAVGVIIPDITNPFFTSVMEGIEVVLRRAGYALLLTNSNEDPQRERENAKLLLAEKVAGVLFTPSGPDDSVYRELVGNGVPIVAISRLPSGDPVDGVAVDGATGAASAVEHLLDLGHRRIAFINGPAWSSSVRERQAGYAAAFAARGLPIPTDLIVEADLRQRGGYEAMRRLLAQANRPTAVFVGNNLMTLGALQAIHEERLAIPKDIAVIGFDDLPWATSLRPALTAVWLPTYEMGASAAQLLLERVEEPRRPARRVVLATRLVVRESCGAIAPLPGIDSNS
jgi:DNA-binding LacI/PurR family transcriptional regulator